MRLTAIRDRVNVNALAKNPPLNFAAAGITVIYGDNGSGKTGYGRLLRLACRARIKPAGLLGNVYAPTSDQSADVRYQVGEEAPVSYAWTPTSRPPDILRRVSVFDGECAAFYVSKRQDIAYQPTGLDLFERLVTCCKAVRTKLQVELDALPSESPWDTALEGTTVKQALDGLPSAVSLTKLERLAVLTPEESAKLKELEEDHAKLAGETPERRAQALTRVHTSASLLVARVTNIVGELCSDAVARTVALAEAAAVAQVASDTAARERFCEAPLRGVGEDVWNLLWAAAREYSTQVAFPDVVFPAVDNAVCVLCQQPLDAAAGERLRSFEAFIQHATSKDAASKRKLLGEALHRIRSLQLTSPDDADVLTTLRERDAQLEQDVRAFLANSALVQGELLKRLEGTQSPEMQALLPISIDRLKQAVNALKAESDRLSKILADGDRIQSETDRKELAARLWLSDHLQHVREVGATRLLRLQLTKAATSGTNTQAITLKGTKVAKEIVTPELAKRFKSELAELRADTIAVDLQHLAGEEGTTYVQLLLSGAGTGVPRDVLSDGELNLASIAAFFAELDPNGADTIIFDDPVSSLDHNHRYEVAARLASEARKRQVIVFTHDLVFFGYLADRASGNKVKISEVTLSNFGPPTGAGVPEQGMPWDVRNVEKRVAMLEHLIRNAKKAVNENRLDDARSIAVDFYEKLRETWERAVETELLGGVVERWRKSVDLGQLKKIAGGIPADRIQIVEKELGHIALFCHSQTPASNRRMPRVDDLEGELKRLSEWRSQLKSGA